MNPSSTLELRSNALVRPIAAGCVAMAGEEEPLRLDDLGERIVAICQRPTDLQDLLEVVDEVSGAGVDVARDRVTALVEAGLLVVATGP